MKWMLRLLMATGSTIIAAAPATAQMVTPPPPSISDTASTDSAYRVMRLRNIAAVDAAKALKTWTEGERRQITFAVDSESNSIVVFGELAARQRAFDILTALDREPASVVIEVRTIRVPAGYCERLGVKPSDAANHPLTEREMRLLMEAVQSNPDCSVLQAPRMTLFDGQTATVTCEDRHHFVTGIEAVNVNGTTVFVPQNKPVDLGDSFALCGKVSSDGQSVNLRVQATRKRLVGEVPLVPVVTQVTPVYERSPGGNLIPVTQYLQVPNIETASLEKSLSVPTGTTAVVGIWKESDTSTPISNAACAALLQFMSSCVGVPIVESPAGTEVIILATVRVICPAAGCNGMNR